MRQARPGVASLQPPALVFLCFCSWCTNPCASVRMSLSHFLTHAYRALSRLLTRSPCPSPLLSSFSGRQVGARSKSNYQVGIDIGMKHWNRKELARLDLRAAGVACGQNDGLQIPYRPLTGGNTFGVPYHYQWVYSQPSRVEDREQAIAQWPGNLRLEGLGQVPGTDTMANAAGVRLVNRNPWVQGNGSEQGKEKWNGGAGIGVLGSPRLPISIFKATGVAAPQSLEEYVQSRKKDACLPESIRVFNVPEPQPLLKTAAVRGPVSSLVNLLPASDDATQVEKNRTESGGRRFRAAFKEGLLAPVPLTERRALGGTGGRTGRALTFTSSLRYLGSEGIGQGTMVRMY